jgi:hypothetical protein
MITALPSLPVPPARAELLAYIARLAGVKAAELAGLGRDDLVLRLRAQVARLGIGDHVRLNLMMIAASALLALERHDELAAPAPAAAVKLREPS